MSEISVRVYSPRGQRGDGGGLIVQVTVPQAEVDAWITPSAQAHASLVRRVERAQQDARAAMVAWLDEQRDRRLAEERERAAQEDRAREQGGGSVQGQGTGSAAAG